MKTIRIILPMIAVMFAFVGSFASSDKGNFFAPVPVVLNTSTCLQVGRCSNVGTSPCKNADQIQTYKRDGEESCSVIAVGDFMNP